MAKRIQDFRNFKSSNDVETFKEKNEKVITQPKKIKNSKNNIKNKKENKNVSNKLTIFFIFLIIAGITVGCLFSPAFNLNGFIVKEGINVTKEEILNSFSVTKGTNIFKIDYEDIETSIEELPYIKNARAKFELPNEVKIEFVEREPFALVKYLESYMVMDKFGYILEITRENKFEKLPIIYNINFNSYEIGKQLEDTAKTKFDNVVYLLENAYQSEFEYTISEINYESISNVKVWVKDVEIEIIYGEIDRNMIGDKLGYIEEILNKTKGKKGKIDISSSNYLDGKMVFTERI